MQQPEHHTPIMLEEVLEFLRPRPGGVYLDGTVGTGGHTEAILQRCGPTGRVFGIDADPESLVVAGQRLATYGERTTLLHGRYEQARRLLTERGVERVDGALLDLGISSVQLATPERGFSFSQDGPLDMRMDRGRGRTVAELLDALSEEELAEVLRAYGEERWARRIARAIVRRRAGREETRTTGDLVRIIREALPAHARRPSRIHPATRSFQALRILANRELEALEGFLEDLPVILRSGGRCCILSYHSLEDRLVKIRFRQWERPELPEGAFEPFAQPPAPLFRRIRKKVVRPSEDEVRRNPLSRSAKLRVAERL